MKKLMFVMALAIFGGIAAGCGHNGNSNVSGKDTTKVDSTDTVKVDSVDSVATDSAKADSLNK